MTAREHYCAFGDYQKVCCPSRIATDVHVVVEPSSWLDRSEHTDVEAVRLCRLAEPAVQAPHGVGTTNSSSSGAAVVLRPIVMI